MATLPNMVSVPCLLGPAQTAANEVNSAAFYRTVRPQPLNTGSSADSGLGSTAPTGPQLWPLKL